MNNTYKFKSVEKYGYPKEDCLCYTHSEKNGLMVLCWNSHYKLWDDAECDDYFCDKEEVDIYMELPNKINIEEIKQCTIK